MIIKKGSSKKRITVLFRWTGHATYTLSVLIGLLDEKLDTDKFTVRTAETEEEIIREARSDNLITVLAYSFCSPQFEDIKREIKLLKETLGPKLLIICGGPHTTALPEDVLKAGADVVFTGEAEESFPSFLNVLYENNGIPDEKIIRPKPLDDFDDYPPFAYKRGFFAPIEIRRGCTTGCAFCQTPRIFKNVKERSIGYISKYTRYLSDARRDAVYFLTPDALSYGSKDPIDLESLESMLKSIHGTDLKINLGNFPSEISPGKLARFPEAAAILEKYVGNTKILLGGQSGSDKVLRLMNRDHSVSDIRDSVRILRGHRFTPIVDILLGFPGESRTDRLQTIRLMKSLSENYKARFNAHYFMPLAGTPLAKADPEPLEDEIKNTVYDMTKSGIVRGDFSEQMSFAGYS